VIPALQRFYGGSPLDWLEVPLPLVGAYALAMRGLQAQESMLMCEVVAMGSGTLEKSDARRIQDGWREAIGGAAHKPPSPEFLASKGIAFSREHAEGQA
jgi:hypothetical protein